MVKTAGLDAKGTQLQRGDGAEPEVFTSIANVNSIEGPEIERETIDVTAHDSPDGWMEFVGGLIDGGELTAEVNYDPSEHDTLIGDFDVATARNYKLVWPDGTEWAFPAILTGFSAEAPVDDKLAAELTWQVSGKPTLTPAA